ncbi:MAG: hypothetical protein J6P29_00575 [Acetobacter sp.]|nr:hypothetical protein [Acetobacter sp.]
MHSIDTTYTLNGGYKPCTKRSADLDGPEFYPTPKWATYALIDNEEFRGDIWECACGNGAMAEVLENTGQKLISSDLYDRGYGKTGVDFLTSERHIPNVITNPPYNAAEGFIRNGLKCAERKCALLLRLAFLEGVNRYNTLFKGTPPSRVWVFSERITFYPEGVKKSGNGTTAYAWFVWDKDASSGTELKWFKPGYKSKYTQS